MTIVQLAESAADPNSYIEDPAWIVEQKLDGHRVLLVSEDGKVTAYNRKGDVKAFPARLADSVGSILSTGRWRLDGELLGKQYWIFDILEVSKGSTTDYPWSVRRNLLDRFAETWERAGGDSNVRFTKWFDTTDDKRKMYEMCFDTGKEGVMFKQRGAPYRVGRQRTWRKYKFVKTCDAVVTELNRKGKVEAMSLGLFDENGQLREAGGCRILPKFAGRISVGDVVEVRYLYSQDATKKLYQPVLLAVRDDKDPKECGQWQLQMTNKQVIQ